MALLFLACGNDEIEIEEDRNSSLCPIRIQGGVQEEEDSVPPESIPASDVSSASDSDSSTPSRFASELPLVVEFIEEDEDKKEQVNNQRQKVIPAAPRSSPPVESGYGKEKQKIPDTENACIQETGPLREDSACVAPSTATETGGTNNSSKSKKVRWGKIEMRKYPIIPGNHPDCATGPPLTVCWEYTQDPHEAVDSFEQHRTPERRKGKALVRSWLDRRRVLRSLGFTDTDMHYAQAESSKIRKRREDTLAKISSPVERLELFKESFLRKARRAVAPQLPLTTRY